MTIHGNISDLFGSKLSSMKPITSQLQRTTETADNSRGMKRASQDAMPKPMKTKGSEESRRKKYLNDDYVSALLLSDRVAAYDSGAKPTYHSNCKFGCKQHFLGMADGATVLRQNLSE